MRRSYFCILLLSLFAALPLSANTGSNQTTTSVTGLPLISYSDDDGFGFGARVFLTGYRPGYEPFKWQLWAQIYRTTKKRENHELSADLMNFMGTPLRVKIQGGYVRFQSAQYYGEGNYQDIQRIKRIHSGQIPINENLPARRDFFQLAYAVNGPAGDEITINESGKLNPGRRILRERQNRYYYYDRVQPYGKISTENWFGQSNFKWWAGFSSTRYTINSYKGDYDDGEAEPNSNTYIDLVQPTGYDATERARLVNLFRFALVYDSRPKQRENDPNRGLFSDIHLASSGKGTGSHYHFNKVTLTHRQYIELFSDFFQPRDEELVFAYRLLGTETFGDAPFFEFNRIYTKAEDSEGLGGTFGLRGYLSNQFVDRVMTMGNFELRYTFSKKAWAGGMNWVALLYFDTGRAAKYRHEITGREWHNAWGGGIRLVWETNTVINISSGVSKFSSFTAFSFGHMF